MKNIGIILCCAFYLIGCQNNYYTTKFEQSEKWMDNAPDSALLILETIRLDDIYSQSDRAKYALLYSQALDKNYIDLKNDSLIRIAVDYYREHGPMKNRMMAYYYLGRVQFNDSNYPHALISFSKAEKCAMDLKENFYQGLIFRGITDVYNETYNTTEELVYAIKTYNAFKNAEAGFYSNYALLDIGIAYDNQRRYDESSKIYDHVLELARNNADTSLLASCLTNYAGQCMETNNPAKARKMLNYVRDELGFPLSVIDLGRLAYAYAKEGKIDSMAFFISMAKNLATDELSKTTLDYKEYQINLIQHDYKGALQKYEAVNIVQDSIVRTILDQSVVTAQRDFIQKEFEEESYKLKTKGYIVIMTIAIALLTVACCVLFFYRRLQIKNLEINEYMSLAHEVQIMLQDRNVEISDMAQLIQQLFQEKFGFIDHLGNTYYERQNTPSEQIAIYNDVKKAIDSLGSDKNTIAELEKIVDTWRKDIMRKIRLEIPNLKESDYQLLCYLYAGFSHRTISIFMHDKIENIYTKKSRLRTRISNSDAIDKDFFLNEMP